MVTTQARKQTITKLRKEVDLLRSFVVGFVGRDEEGEYRPEFVRKVLNASDKKPTYQFQNAKSFLSQLTKIG